MAKGQGQGQGPLKLLAALRWQLTLLTIYKVGSMRVPLLLEALDGTARVSVSLFYSSSVSLAALL